jgi:hypothetical protein
MHLSITYDYGDMTVEWCQWTGTLLLFTKDGERVGVLPRAYSQDEVENILRQELGYVPEKQTVRAATYNVFPIP